MSKRGYLFRYQSILQKLRAQPYSSFEELKRYLESQFEYLQIQDDRLEVGFSKRTLQRDIREIRNLYGFNIEYSRSRNGYFLNQSVAESRNFERMLEAFDIFNSLNISQNLSPHIHFENRRPQGTENLFGLLHAIKNNKQIKFSYFKFGEDIITHRVAEPYALKEFRNRWYLLAKDLGDAMVKTFALDRFTKLEITNLSFDRPPSFNVEDHYRYCFGIISPSEEEPTDILLSLTPFQAKYIKTLPLHESQQIIMEDQNEVRIILKVFPTHDFFMELLSLGENVKVLQPSELVERVKKAHWEAYKRY